jgi:acyl-coenzyme A synthetase/AMP-(fatty) acid ligase
MELLRHVTTGEIGIHLPHASVREAVLGACASCSKRVVGLGSRPDVVITADGIFDNGSVRLLKEEVDEAVPDASLVIVLRLLGNVPLGPTYDAYLYVDMRPGRDVWIDYVGASG